MLRKFCFLQPKKKSALSSACEPMPTGASHKGRNTKAIFSHHQLPAAVTCVQGLSEIMLSRLPKQQSLDRGDQAIEWLNDAEAEAVHALKNSHATGIDIGVEAQALAHALPRLIAVYDRVRRKIEKPD